MNWIKHAFILVVDFVGLLIILSILLIVLNYFKIIPLSKTFPKYFSFLPQISKNVKKTIYAPTPVPTATPIIWDKQTSPTLVSNYSDYFKKQNAPIPTGASAGLFLESGAFTAYNKNYVQAVTSEGLTVFQITNDTIFRKISPPTTNKSQGGNGINRITAIYKNSADFFNDAPFGGYLEITYKLNGVIKIASEVNYYPNHKF